MYSKILHFVLLFLVLGCSEDLKKKSMAQQSGNGLPPDPDVPFFSYSDQEKLGKMIFNDNRLSEPQGVSCASCHDSTKAFSGNNGSSIPAVAQGSTPGSFGSRNTPMLTYASFSVDFHFYPASDLPGQPITFLPFGGQFLDGRALNFSEQVEGPLLNPIEMNNPDKATVISKIETAPYRELYISVCGSRASRDTNKAFKCISDAISAFEFTPLFAPFSSKFDAFLKGTVQLTNEEAQGFSLFKDPAKGNCLSCHRGTEGSNYPGRWLFTDFGYDSIGTPRNSVIPANSDANHFDIGLCNRPNLASFAPPGTDLNQYCTMFKNPSLRNVALTAPYGHNGVFATLNDAVKFYATRDTNPEDWYSKDINNNVIKFDDSPNQYHANINRLPPFDLNPGDTPHLNQAEIDEIVAFLNTLTDGYKGN